MVSGVVEYPWTPPFVELKMIARNATPRTQHYQQPGIRFTPSGALHVLAALDENPSSTGFDFGGTKSQSWRSSNGGVTWTADAEGTGYGTEVFSVGSDMYWLSLNDVWGTVGIRKSTDNGATWGAKTTLLTDGAGTAAPNYTIVASNPLITGGRVYIPVMNTPDQALFANQATITVLHASTSSDLTLLASWTHSAGVQLSGGVTTGDAHVGFWEPQIFLDKDDNAKIICRVKSDRRLDLSAVIDLTLGASASLSYNTSTGLRTMQGGHVLFRIGICPVTDKYLAITTRNTIGSSTDDHYNQRTILSLISSDDLTTWTHVTDILRAQNFDTLYKAISEGYQYVQWIFNGNDIVGVIRVGEHIIAINHHQASALYFFRIRNYYQNLLAPAPTNSGVSPSGPAAVTRNGRAV